MTQEFHCPISFHLTKHGAIPGRPGPDTYRLAMKYWEDTCPVTLLGVQVPEIALQHFTEGTVKGVHIETLVQDSVAKKALGYPNHLVMGVLLKDGTRLSVTPAKLRSALWRYVLIGGALTVAGAALVWGGQTVFGIATLLAGTHVFRTGMDVPHTQFWGHWADVK